MTKPSETIRLRIDADLLKRIGKRAKAEQRTASSLIRYAVVKYLEEACESDK